MPTSTLSSSSISVSVAVPEGIGFTSGTYGTSAQGRNLNFYKIGSSTANVFVAVFAQHGFEDVFPADGEGLTVMAAGLVENLARNADALNLRNNWSIYIVPCANPDALINGFTCIGHGRTTMGSSTTSAPRDLNRSWPSTVLPDTYTDRRNMNHGLTSTNIIGPLADASNVTTANSPELKALYNKINSDWFPASAGRKFLLDVHGWLNYMQGNNSTVNGCFTAQFTGLGANANMGMNQMLSNWGRTKLGTTVSTTSKNVSALLELPVPTYNAAGMGTVWNTYTTKLTAAVKNSLTYLLTI